MSDDQTPKQDMIPGGRGGFLKPIRSSERARELAILKHEKKQAAIRAGIAAAAAQLPGVQGTYGMLRAISENHAAHAYDPSQPGAQRSLEILLRHGWSEPARDAEANTVTADPNQLAALALLTEALDQNPALRERAFAALA